MGDVVSLQSMGFGGVSGFQRRHCRQGCTEIMGEHGSGIARDFNVRAGEKKRVALSVSNFAGDAKDATLRVSLVACRGVNDFNVEAQGGRERGECTGCVWSDERKVPRLIRSQNVCAEACLELYRVILRLSVAKPS